MKMHEVKKLIQDKVPKFQNRPLRLFLNSEFEFYEIGDEVKTRVAFFDMHRQRFYVSNPNLYPSNTFEPNDEANFLDLDLTVGNTVVFFTRAA